MKSFKLLFVIFLIFLGSFSTFLSAEASYNTNTEQLILPVEQKQQASKAQNKQTKRKQMRRQKAQKRITKRLDNIQKTQKTQYAGFIAWFGIAVLGFLAGIGLLIAGLVTPIMWMWILGAASIGVFGILLIVWFILSTQI